MPIDKTKNAINYTSREYSSIRRDLINHAKRYYPQTFKDFSEASFGSFMVDAVSYVGDILSFYLDYNTNESFMDSAIEYGNVLRHAKQFGYKFNGRTSTFGIVALYVIVPALAHGVGPNPLYTPVLQKGTRFTAVNGSTYTLTENIDFKDDGNEVVVARVDDNTSAPTHFAIKSNGAVVSGRLMQERIAVGQAERFKKVKLSHPSVAEIISIFDTDGHRYYEVDYLSQNVVYTEVANPDSNDDNARSIMKPVIVPRRYIIERFRGESFLQFGYGSDSELDSGVLADPTDVIMDIYGRKFSTVKTLDPSKLMSTDKFGVAPSNTTLNITYRVIDGDGTTNVPIGGLNRVESVLSSYPDPTKIASDIRRGVNRSIEVYNEEPITGDVRFPNVEEIKRRTYDYFPTQARAVTKVDYEAMAYAMPAKFGAIKRCMILRDPDSLKRNLNMYILSEDSNGYLVKASSLIKQNLKMWLNQYRMVNDTIDILDAKIVNFGVEFTIKSSQKAVKSSILSRAVREIHFLFRESKLYIGEAINIGAIYKALNRIPGVIDTTKVKIIHKTGTNYSDTRFPIYEATSADGLTINIPKNVVAELKYTTADIRGTIK